MEIHIIILISLLSTSWIIFLYLIRKIQFAYPTWEDATYMIDAAAEASSWHWPSQMHNPSRRSIFTKDITVLFLALFQRIFQDKKSPFPLLAMQGFMNIASAFLIFLIANSFWSLPIAWIMTILFIVSFWPWQNALNIGHVNVATFFFLLAIYASILSSSTNGLMAIIWMILTGCFFAALVFSSASWVKYVGLFFAGIIFTSNKGALSTGDWPAFFSVLSYDQYLLHNIIVLIVIISIVLILKFNYRKIIELMYRDQLPLLLKKVMTLLNRDMSGKKDFSLAHYQNYAKRKLQIYGSWSLRIIVLLFFVLNFVGLKSLSLFLLGFFLILLLLTLPDIKKSLLFYWFYIRENQIRQKTGFRDHANYFAKIGIHVNRYSRSGFMWVPKVFFRLIPFITAGFFVALSYLIISDIAESQYKSLLTTLLIAITALLPIIWGEITSAVSSARNWFAGFIGLLIFIGYSLDQIYQSFPDNFMLFISPILTVYILWNLYNFFTDILPSRMTINNLINALSKLNIKEFYTYKTGYNNILVDALRPHIRDSYTIKYINCLDEIKNGWLVIPATDYKTAVAPAEDIIEAGDDFKQDPILNGLLSTRKMEKIATEKFKTFGSSRFWIQDNEAVGYHDLILNDITTKDRFRSYAWLLNVKDLKKL